MSFSTVFQSYLDDGWVVMKGNERLCVMGPCLRLQRYLPQAKLGPRTAGSVGKRIPVPY